MRAPRTKFMKNKSVKFVLVAVLISIGLMLGCISDSTWQWYSIDACSNQAIFFNTKAEIQSLAISPSNTSLEIDRFLLTSSPSIQLNNHQPSCSGSIATITASGPTSFCQGDSVRLTADSANAFLWSNGKTSQSIYVSSAGNYSVTVLNNTGCNG